MVEAGKLGLKLNVEVNKFWAVEENTTALGFKEYVVNKLGS